MPYTDKAKQAKYQRDRAARLKAEWLRENGPCCHCGSTERLEVDHIDPSTKVSHNVWSWNPIRRAEELKKCQVLCKSCHKEKSDNAMKIAVPHGTHSGYSHHGCRCVNCCDAHREYNRRAA